MERSSRKKLNILHTDNGGEYVSTKFEDYLKSEGIRHERTVPKTPEQNGVAERMNRTLVETMHSMLIDAKLPHAFWAEAISTAVYLRNRSPTKVLEDMTQFEAWMKQKPCVEHLRVFDCDAYAHVAKDERKKLESKSRKCIFLGYGEETKGYGLYVSSRSKVIYSRDVQFNEEGIGSSKVGQMLCTEEDKHHVKLEFNTDDFSDDHLENEVATSEATVQPVLRRSERAKRAPDFYGERANVSDSRAREPTTLEEALESSDKEKWFEAMTKEMKSLDDNKVWFLSELPEG